MDPAQRRLAQRTMRELVDPAWLETLDPDSPEWLRELISELIGMHIRGDLDSFLATAHPDLQIVQPPEIPGATTYRSGRYGLLDAILDWPQQWEGFEVRANRIFAIDDSRWVIQATHSGRSRAAGVEVQAEIVWVFTYEDGLMRRWDMYMDLDQALRAEGAGA
jgi:ketosteroid isomerase-like protein